MGLRASNPSLEKTRAVREVISSLLPEIGAVNEEVALIEAAAGRQHRTQADMRRLLERALAAQTRLQRIEQQLGSALVGQPNEIANHGRIRDVRAAIRIARERLERLGA
jgi:hypothetical protein